MFDNGVFPEVKILLIWVCCTVVVYFSWGRLLVIVIDKVLEGRHNLIILIDTSRFFLGGGLY